jgi:hypothetical protein
MEVAMDGIEERDLRVSIWVVDLQVVESVNLFLNLNVDRYYSSSSHLSTPFTSELVSTLVVEDSTSKVKENRRLAIANFWGSRSIRLAPVNLFYRRPSLSIIELLHNNTYIYHEHTSEGERLLYAVEEYCWSYWE